LIVFRDDLNYVIIYYNYIEMSDPVCVKLIDNDEEFKGIKTKEPSIKIAIKDGDKYTITDSNNMDGTDFEKDSMYAQVDAPAVSSANDDDASVDGDGDADKAAAERKRLEEEAERKRLEEEAERKRLEEEAERKRLEAERKDDKLMSNVTPDSDDETVDSEITTISSATTLPAGAGVNDRKIRTIDSNINPRNQGNFNKPADGTPGTPDTARSTDSGRSNDTTVSGGKRRKSTKRGRKSTRKGRKSSGKGRKSVKRGRKGKGSRRSKK